MSISCSTRPKSRFLLLFLLGSLVFAGCEPGPVSPYDTSEATRRVVHILPENTFALAQADVKNLLEHPKLQEMLRLEEHFAEMKADSGFTLQSLIDSIGFDPFFDLATVHMAVFDDNQESAEGLFVVTGTFDSDSILDVVRRQTGVQIEERAYGEFTVFTADTTHGPLVACFPEEGVLLATSRVEVLEDILDRWASGEGTADPELLALLDKVPWADGPWMVVSNLFPQIAKADGMPQSDFAQALPFLKDAAGAVRIGVERIDVAVTATTTKERESSAGDVADLVKGAIAAMKIRVQDETEVDMAMDMLDRIQVKHKKGTITVRFFAEEDDMERLFESMRDMEALKTKKTAATAT